MRRGDAAAASSAICIARVVVKLRYHLGKYPLPWMSLFHDFLRTAVPWCTHCELQSAKVGFQILL